MFEWWMNKLWMNEQIMTMTKHACQLYTTFNDT